MTINVDAILIRQQITSILHAWGMPDDLIAQTADVMVETDLWGVDSHGISMLMTYELKINSGRFRISERPRIVRETPVMAMIDAGAGLGHPASVLGMHTAIEKAAKVGLAVVTVNNSHHFGAAGYYARMASDRGMIGLVTSTARNIAVVPTRAAQPVLGTNPLAFAAPAGRNPPFLLDIATSTVAAGKIKVYGYQNKQLPEGWVVGPDGNSLRDGNEAYEVLRRGTTTGLTPIGGTPELSSHKGYGLGMMVHILGGVLAGAAFAPLRIGNELPGEPENIGHFFMAIDPNAFRAEGEFEADMDSIIDVLRATPATDPAKPVLVAGDPEIASRAERLTKGIPIPAALQQQLRDLCGRANVPYVLAEA